MNVIKYILVFILLFTGSISGQVQSGDLSAPVLNAQYKKLIKKYNVPGLSVAIVSGDSTLINRGFGYRSKAKQKKVNNYTLFGIASLSKTFTAALVANAIADQKLTLDTPVQKVLPYFELYDPYVTNKLTLKDALSHRTGLNSFSGDLIWYGSTISDSAIIHRMRHLQPKYDFRTHFGYSNIMYLVTGKILEKIYQKPYAKLLDSIILQPLRMNKSCATYSEAMQVDNLAIPHVEYKQNTIKQPYISWDNMQPAGGIFSNATEMTRYLKMWLNEGKYRNHSIIEKTEFNKLFQQQIPLDMSWIEQKMQAPVNFKNYGIGWALMDYDGRKVYYHSGGLDGMTSQIVLIPEHKTGAVFMANKTSALPTVLMYDLLEKLSGRSEINYPDSTLALLNNIKKTQTTQAEIYNAPDSIAKDFFIGTFYDSLVGKAVIERQNDSLCIHWNESKVFDGYLMRTDLLSFELYWPAIPSLPKGKLNFEVNGVGKITGFTIDLPNPDLHFNELHFRKINK